MEVTKQTFDHAARYLLGHKFDHLREAESFSRSDICNVIALDEFVDTLFGADLKEKTAALDVVRAAAVQLWYGLGCPQLDD
jgi:hypothetical protein